MTELPDHVTELQPPAGDAAVPAWLAAQANAGRPFLLAFADDGVVWGRWGGGKLTTAAEAAGSTAFAAPLRGETLWQASVFGPDDEARLFRDENGAWQARLITDGPDTIQESQLLIGDMVVQSLPGFTHLRDKRQQGLDHIAPVKLTAAEVDDKDDKPVMRARLLVRHQVTQDEKTGEARIDLSRLVEVTTGPRHQEE